MIINLGVAVSPGVALVEEGLAAGVRRGCGLRDRLALEGDLASLAERTIDEVKLIGLAETRDDEQPAFRRKPQWSRLARTQIGVQRFGGIRRSIRNSFVDQIAPRRGWRRMGDAGEQQRDPQERREKDASHYSYVPKPRR